MTEPKADLSSTLKNSEPEPCKKGSGSAALGLDKIIIDQSYNMKYTVDKMKDF